MLFLYFRNEDEEARNAVAEFITEGGQTIDVGKGWSVRRERSHHDHTTFHTHIQFHRSQVDGGLNSLLLSRRLATGKTRGAAAGEVGSGDPVDRVGTDARDHVAQVCLGLDAVELCRSGQLTLIDT
jgi:hypothetical protein